MYHWQNRASMVGAAVMLMYVASVAWAGATLQWLPALPGDTGTSAHGISADGSVVVGSSYTDGESHAVYWKFGGPAQAMGVLDAGNNTCTAMAASADGAVIVGYASTYANGDCTSRTFRWTAQTGMVSLGEAPGEVLQNQALGVSADGSVVVGQYQITPFPEAQHGAFRWTQGSGLVSLPSLMPELPRYNRASGVSADGSVIVGKCGYGGPFRWTQAGGVESLYGLTDDGLSEATAVSADGTIIVGSGNGPHMNGLEAFIWRQDTGVEWLGVPVGKIWSWANDVSDDGKVVVGTAEYEGKPTEAIIWTEAKGLRHLREALYTDYGLDIPADALREATGISADGNIIVGNGWGRAWMLMLPEPGAATLLLAMGACVGLRRRERLP